MQSHSLDEELKNCSWILDKLKNSESYAQNLYAAFCNVEWQKHDIWAILKEETWSVSWRTAGGIIAELRDQGENYMHFYCSGIFNSTELEEQPILRDFVAEGTVTQEIERDLAQLGWFIFEDRNK